MSPVSYEAAFRESFLVKNEITSSAMPTTNAEIHGQRVAKMSDERVPEEMAVMSYICVSAQRLKLAAQKANP